MKNKSNLISIFAGTFLALTLSLGTAYAHCGQCGTGDSHAEKNKASHAEFHKDNSMQEVIAKMQARATTFEEASSALSSSHPELSQKLQGYADEEKQWIAHKKEFMAKHDQWVEKHVAEMKSAKQ